MSGLSLILTMNGITMSNLAKVGNVILTHGLAVSASAVALGRVELTMYLAVYRSQTDHPLESYLMHGEDGNLVSLVSRKNALQTID